jgi:hypothetical protein
VILVLKFFRNLGKAIHRLFVPPTWSSISEDERESLLSLDETERKKLTEAVVNDELVSFDKSGAGSGHASGTDTGGAEGSDAGGAFGNMLGDMRREIIRDSLRQGEREGRGN